MFGNLENFLRLFQSPLIAIYVNRTFFFITLYFANRDVVKNASCAINFKSAVQSAV